jgi:hypothetical protein
VTEDLVDVFYGDLVRPLGNLVILFAQAEASLIDLVMDLGGFDQKKAQGIVNGRGRKRSVAALARKSGLEDFDLTELLKDIDQYWANKESRNRYIHDEWFVNVLDGGSAATRGLPLKKDATVVWDSPKYRGCPWYLFGGPPIIFLQQLAHAANSAEEVWKLANRFREHDSLFSSVAYWRRRARSQPSDSPE